MELRTPGLADVPGVYRVCFETAGVDPTMNPDLLGHVYAGPYVARHPELSRVVVDDHGVAGYVFGCPDTLAFEAWCDENWWPTLRRQYPMGSGDAVDAELIGLLHTPPTTPPAVLDDYPAHLHIDLLPRTQGHGYGRVLIEWLCDELVALGVPGVHLGVGSTNTNAIAFYGHLGFVTLDDDGDTRFMARRLG